MKQCNNDLYNRRSFRYTHHSISYFLHFMFRLDIASETSRFDCLIVPLFEDGWSDRAVTDLDRAYDGILFEARKLGDFEGKAKQTTLLYTKNGQSPRLLLLGLGKKKQLSIRAWKQAVGTATVLCQNKKMKQLGLVVPAAVASSFGAKQAGQATAVAAVVASYAYDEHKTEKDARVVALVSFSCILDADARIRRAWTLGAEDGRQIGEAINTTRHLGNTPPSILTPTYLAKHAQTLQKLSKHISVRVLSRPEIEKLHMGCFLGVAKGSEQEPKFIIVEYAAATKKEKPTVLVGKGITFDSGGLSLKPGNYLCDMKFDMLGGATVLGIIQAAAALGMKKNIVGLVPACENMPSGTAYRPDDILVNMEGKTVEVQNTDAEGRLILCDALSYAKKYQPKEVIDFATLTGACVVAIGNERAGLFTDDESLLNGLSKNAEKTGEQLWRLPLGEEFSDAMKSTVADIKNIGGVGGNERYGGASAAAAFLEFFTKDKEGNAAYPWAHIDMANAYFGGKGKPWLRGGASGACTETVIEYLRS